MYRNFFSLSDLPFSISPDPKYLFMSERHKEALAHLTYGLGGSGLGENGGFALLTGEVGTGKTTISRCLMEQLPDNTQVAFILNPTLSSKELLATLCDELKIRYRKSDASLKILTDKIAAKLLKNHENDINTLLIIDEAQHLQPEVLEQLRLLTNLETNTKKLLQVILIGQPELQQLLQRRDLRQLAQRITARYHLMPLNKQELTQYVAYRLSIAGCPRTLFNPRAMTKIHQLSGGIPRLINLLCHSSLMIAYNQNDSLVNKKIVIKAAEQALGNDLASFNQSGNSQPTSNVAVKITAGLSLVAIVSVVGLSAFLWGRDGSGPSLPIASVTVEESKQEESSVETKTEALQAAKITKVAKADEQLEISGNKTSARELAAHREVISDSGEVVELTVERKTIPKIMPEPEPELNPKSIPEITVTPEKEPIKTSQEAAQLDNVSDDLLARFQSAVDETSDNSPNDSITPLSNNKQESVKSLMQMPNWVQNGVPSLTFEQHIYSSDGQGWVKVNGRDRYEGDLITPDLELSKILPQQVILRYRGETFSLPALTNW